MIDKINEAVEVCEHSTLDCISLTLSYEELVKLQTLLKIQEFTNKAYMQEMSKLLER